MKPHLLVYLVSVIACCSYASAMNWKDVKEFVSGAVGITPHETKTHANKNQVYLEEDRHPTQEDLYTDDHHDVITERSRLDEYHSRAQVSDTKDKGEEKK